MEYITTRSNRAGSITKSEITENYEIRGELTEMIKVEGYRVYKGRYIQPSDIDESRKVIVLGKRVEEVMFGSGNWENAIGEYVTAYVVEMQVVRFLCHVRIR